VNLVRAVHSRKFICCCWRNPWCDCHVTHTEMQWASQYTGKLLIVAWQYWLSLCFLRRLRNTTQLRSGTVDISKRPVFL